MHEALAMRLARSGVAQVRAVGTANVRAVGARAHAALERCAGRTSAVPGFEATGFRLAAGELVWVGLDAPLHPRVVLLEAGCAHDRLDLEAATVHAPAVLPRLGTNRENASNSASMAVLRLISEYELCGFATLFAGRPPVFPLCHRTAAAGALAAACAHDDAARFANAAARLLGVGGGLTPSGDDFVGGALFARRLIGVNDTWLVAAAGIVELSQVRTHAVSAALLADLAAGSSYAALHELAAALAKHGAAPQAADAPMQALVGIGHSSGWDMLAGFIAGLTGRLEFSRN